jgi:WD and tetratricopeptide repeat-containing protein 1
MQPEAAIDMKQRFIGHCNVGTDIKQANFLGQRGVLSISFSVNFTISSELYHNFTKCAKTILSLSLCVCCRLFSYGILALLKFALEKMYVMSKEEFL